MEKHKDDACRERGACSSAHRHHGFGSYSSVEGPQGARKSTQIVREALQAVSLSSRIIADILMAM